MYKDLCARGHCDTGMYCSANYQSYTWVGLVCGCGGVGGGCIRKYFKLQAGRVLITLTARAML